MGDFRASVQPRLAAVGTAAARIGRSRRTRRIALIALIVLVVYGLLGFLAAPPVIRGQIQQRASAALGRKVTVRHVRFDPYTLRLQLNQVAIAGRASKTPFITIDRAVINASWTSLFRLAPVLDALDLDRPSFRIARTAPGQYNFIDIIKRLAAHPSKSRSPFRYAVSNITVRDGAIRFTDAVTHSTHAITHIDIGIPFLANLPRDMQVYVKPLLAMDVDGSPIRIAGETRPFAHNRESDLRFHFQRLDLPRYVAYAPGLLPFDISKGVLGGNLTLHFMQTAAAPKVQVSGTLQFDDLALASAQGQPILALRHGTVGLADVQPLASQYDFGAIQLDGAQLWYTETGPGHSNLDSLTTPASKPATKSALPKTTMALKIASLALADSTFHYADPDRHALDLDKLHGTVTGLALGTAPPAKLDLAGDLDGGNIAAKGALDLGSSTLAATLTLRQVGMAPLQGVAGLPLDGHTADGKLSAAGDVRVDWGSPFDIELAKAKVGVSGFALQPHDQRAAVPIAWQQLDVVVDRLDLAQHTAQVRSVAATGLKLDVERFADKRINLLELLAAPPAPSTSAAKSPAWRWHVAHVGFDDAAIAVADHAAGPKPVAVKLQKLTGSIDDLGDQLDGASPVKLSGAIGRGTFDLAGTVHLSPLAADLRVTTQHLGIAAFEPYVGVPLNVTVSRAAITGRGQLRYATRGATPRIAFRGDAALDDVRVQDKLTGDDFLRWRALAARNLVATLGSGTPRVDIGHLTLTAFFARMIINPDGRLNLSDVIANPASAPVSVTRANDEGTAPASSTAAATRHARTAAATSPAGSAAAPAKPAADIHIGGITLAYGQLNFTDDFIKPNYTANLTRLHGTIGAFGTAPGAPAKVAIESALNDNAPVAINGTMNPLQPEAQLDITGKATGVLLDRVSTYAAKYTGYPITAGKLNADVHYQLAQGKLQANNHFFITQLTFGERDESPGVRHLPVKLAVSLLKDAQGNIDINLPVSGSLDDPQFSIGGLVWRAVVGLITKAVTAPFRLLGAAFGGDHHENLDYVAFAPGSAVLDRNAEARLTRVAALLKQKPGLTLQLTGRVDPAKDVAGLRKVTVDDLIKRAKLQETEGRHADASPAALAAVQITPDEYVKYLKRAYRDDDIKDKPRDYFGLKLPKPAEMRKLMEGSVPTDEAALQALAERRADAVRTWLTAGRLPADRIAIEAPKLSADGLAAGDPATQVQFGIAQH